jgi:hypothetical protein
MTEALHLRPMPDDTRCEVHDWTFERARRELVPLLRARHGRGGLNVCVDCVSRFKAAALARVANRNS